MPDTAIHAVDAKKRFGDTPVLTGVTLEIECGQFVGLAGANGAGKTTLIKCALDLCNLDSGAIHIHGISSERPEARKDLSFLPERFNPPWFMRGAEFLRLMHDFASAPDNALQPGAVLGELGLTEPILDRPVRTYSKGMTQKLGLAACFLSGSKLLVLDEPFSGLDTVARASVKRILSELKKSGATLLFTSHSLADVEEICDHMVVLHRGSVVFHGPPGDLRDRYGTLSLEQAFLNCVNAEIHG